VVYITYIIEIPQLYSNKLGLSHKNNQQRNYVLIVYGEENYEANYGGRKWRGKR
jgi:hypothetical protein